MWTRAELKHRGKAAFKSNYWKTVLVAAILSLLTYSSSLPRGSSDSSSEGLSETTRMLADPASALSTNSQLVAGFFVGIGLTALVVIAVLGILIGVLLVLPLQWVANASCFSTSANRQMCERFSGHLIATTSIS